MRSRSRKTGRLRAIALAAAAVVGAVPSPARANHTVEMSASRLAAHADHVILGRIASVECALTEAAHGIETRVRLEAVTYFKGGAVDADTSYDLVVPGGTIGPRTLRLCCAPEFEVGGVYMLFLQDAWRVHPVVGLHQGAFRIERGRVLRANTGLPIVGIEREGRLQVGRTTVPAPRIVPAVAGARTRVHLHEEFVPTRAMSITAFLAALDRDLAAPAAVLDHPVQPAAPEPMRRAPLQEARR